MILTHVVSQVEYKFLADVEAAGKGVCLCFLREMRRLKVMGPLLILHELHR